MNQAEQLDEVMICRLEQARPEVSPCSIVIFGASGDLTARKLIPAFYHLFKDQQMPARFRILGVARREKTHDSFRAELREALGQFSRSKPVDDAVWQAFAANISYCQGDLSDPAAYARLDRQLAGSGDEALRRNLLFYLAASPSQFAEVAGRLHAAQLLRKDEREGWQRLVVEKPFGHDLGSARALNGELMRCAHERQVFRIDHYLGKETVQNILMFRFANSIFERLWNRDSIDHVQITVSERPGVGGRGGYYEEAGALRDMVQNTSHFSEPPLALRVVLLSRWLFHISGRRSLSSYVRHFYVVGDFVAPRCPAVPFPPGEKFQIWAGRVFLDHGLKAGRFRRVFTTRPRPPVAVAPLLCGESSTAAE